MINVIEFVAQFFPLYRATQDAGMWMFSAQKEAFQSYLESFAMPKGN